MKIGEFQCENYAKKHEKSIEMWKKMKLKN